MGKHMMEKINKLTPTRIEVVKTIEQKEEFEKVTLERMKEDSVAELERINALLSNF